jgi:hypothetical protein
MKDLTMMVAYESEARERTEAEYRSLLNETGFDFVELTRLDATARPPDGSQEIVPVRMPNVLEYLSQHPRDAKVFDGAMGPVPPTL